MSRRVALRGLREAINGLILSHLNNPQLVNIQLPELMEQMQLVANVVDALHDEQDLPTFNHDVHHIQYITAEIHAVWNSTLADNRNVWQDVLCALLLIDSRRQPRSNPAVSSSSSSYSTSQQSSQASMPRTSHFCTSASPHAFVSDDANHFDNLEVNAQPLNLSMSENPQNLLELINLLSAPIRFPAFEDQSIHHQPLGPDQGYAAQMQNAPLEDEPLPRRRKKRRESIVLDESDWSRLKAFTHGLNEKDLQSWNDDWESIQSYAKSRLTYTVRDPKALTEREAEYRRAKSLKESTVNALKEEATSKIQKNQTQRVSMDAFEYVKKRPHKGVRQRPSRAKTDRAVPKRPCDDDGILMTFPGKTRLVLEYILPYSIATASMQATQLEHTPIQGTILSTTQLDNGTFRVSVEFIIDHETFKERLNDFTSLYIYVSPPRASRGSRQQIIDGLPCCYLKRQQTRGRALPQKTIKRVKAWLERERESNGTSRHFNKTHRKSFYLFRSFSDHCHANFEGNTGDRGTSQDASDQQDGEFKEEEST
jgi:hypothetical protein